MYRFLLRPRWLAGHLLLIVTVVTCINLGFWQLRRLEERRAYNTLVTQRLSEAPVPFAAALAGGADPAQLDFRRVEVTGTYEQATQLLTAPRSFAGRPGQQVLTVLASAAGQDLLVDRGYLPFDRRTPGPPPAPAGEVRLAGVLRAAEPGDVGTAEQVARIVPDQIAGRVGRPLAAVYLQLGVQQPTAAPSALTPTPLPALSEGSHQSYALQWFSFAVIALVGYPLLLRRAARGGRDGDPDSAPQPGRRRAVTGTSVR